MQANFKKLLKEEQTSLDFGSNDIQNVWLKVKSIFRKPTELTNTERRVEKKYKLPKASKVQLFSWGIGLTAMYVDVQGEPLYAWIPEYSHDFETKIREETGLDHYSQAVRQSGKVLESNYDDLVLFKRD